MQELGSLSLVPFPPEMKTAVDLGCGTGIWARTMAVQHPETIFIGVDINPPIEGKLETAENSNCHFVKGNVEDEWTFVDEAVDYSLARMLTTAIRDWQGLYDKAFRATRPGGYFESQETFIGLLSDDHNNEEVKSSPLMIWFNSLAEFARTHGIETNSVDTHGQRLENAGFEIIAEKSVKWYFDASRPEMKGKEQISHMVMEQISDILDTMTPKIFARSTSRSLEEGQKLARDAKVDLRKNSGRFGFHTR